MGGDGVFSWEGLLSDLDKLAHIYEKANRCMTFFLIDCVRRKAVSLIGMENRVSVILDAGSGPGVMTGFFREKYGKAYVIMLDPLERMLRRGDRRDDYSDRIRGVFEHIPLRRSSVDLSFAGFSIRDAIDVFRALREMSRVVRRGGALAVLDIGKPLSRRAVSLFLEDIYIRFLPRIIGGLVMGRKGISVYKGLLETYKHFPYTPALYIFLKKLLGRATGFYLVFSTLALVVGFKEKDV